MRKFKFFRGDESGKLLYSSNGYFDCIKHLPSEFTETDIQNESFFTSTVKKRSLKMKEGTILKIAKLCKWSSHTAGAEFLYLKCIIPNCRSCLIDEEYLLYDFNHEIINSNLYCLLCKSMVDSFNHFGNDQDGQSFECSQCNNYILYFSGKDLLYKDEIYFDNEKCLIRGYEDNTSYFWYSKYKSITIDSLLFFDNKDELFNKLNKLIMFA